MRKAELINAITEKTGIPKVDVLVTVESLIKEIKETMAGGENIYIRGFGTFLVKKRAEKLGRNIRKNETVLIPAHYKPTFKASKDFIAELKDLTSVKESDDDQDDDI